MALFQRRRSRIKAEDQMSGLVVGPRAIVILKKMPNKDGVRQPDEVVFDGLAEAERDYRMNGRPPVIFEDDTAEEFGAQPR